MHSFMGEKRGVGAGGVVGYRQRTLTYTYICTISKIGLSPPLALGVLLVQLLDLPPELPQLLHVLRRGGGGGRRGGAQRPVCDG